MYGAEDNVAYMLFLLLSLANFFLGIILLINSFDMEIIYEKIFGFNHVSELVSSYDSKQKLCTVFCFTL